MPALCRDFQGILNLCLISKGEFLVEKNKKEEKKEKRKGK